jgi:hypothetical protein
MLDPYILNPVLNSLSFEISEFHLRMRQICRPKVYNYRDNIYLTRCYGTIRKISHRSYFITIIW